MVAHLGLRPHELLFEESVNGNGEILSIWVKAGLSNDTLRMYGYLDLHLTFFLISDLFIWIFIQTYRLGA